MRKIHELTHEQRLFAQEHHNIIYSFLNSWPLDERDFYDVAAFGYLSAVQEYLEKPHLQSYCFTTIAWLCMKDAVLEEYKYLNRQKRKGSTFSYIDEQICLDNFLPNRVPAMEDMMSDREIVLRILSTLTPKEQELVHLKADGYTHREIGELLNLTAYGVGNRFYRLRKKLGSIITI